MGVRAGVELIHVACEESAFDSVRSDLPEISALS